MFTCSMETGFDPKSLQKACCGSGGDYEFSLNRMCGAPNVAVCDKPQERISWDGVAISSWHDGSFVTSSKSFSAWLDC